MVREESMQCVSICVYERALFLNLERKRERNIEEGKLLEK